MIRAPRAHALALTLGALLLVAGSGFAQNPVPAPPAPPPPAAAPTPTASPAAAPASAPAIAVPANAAPASAAAKPAAVPVGPPVKLPDSLSGISIVTYVTGSTVYLSTGSRDGVWQNSRVVVLKQGAIIAELKVKFLSSHSASCEIQSSTGQVSIYDTVRFSKVPKENSTVATVKRPTGFQQSALRSVGIRGRLGMSYQWVAGAPDSSGNKSTISQPAADVRVDGFNVGGSPMAFSVDARTRTTFSVAPNGSSNTNRYMRVYQANVTWLNVPSGTHVTAGRQYVAALSTISLFDGVTVEVDKDHWSFGGLGGTQPDPISMSWSSQIQEFGAFAQLHQGPVTAENAATAARWSITSGLIDSYDNGQINREFLFVQGFYATQRLTIFATQEVDYNRGWKSAAGLPTLQPTSSFLTANLQLSSLFSLYGGFDNRQNVRLWRDSVTPETAFDDSFREGMWAGFSVTPVGLFHLGADARVNQGGIGGRSDAYTGWLQSGSALPAQGLLRLRATRYTSDRADGWLYSVNFGLTPLWRLHFNLTGGLRKETVPPLLAGGTPIPNQVHWFGVDLDVGLTRSWYLLFSGMSTTGGVETNQQIYTSLSYRF